MEEVHYSDNQHFVFNISVLMGSVFTLSTQTALLDLFGL